MLNKGYSDAMHLYQELWELLFFPILDKMSIYFGDTDVENSTDDLDYIDKKCQSDILYSNELFTGRFMLSQLIDNGIDTSKFTGTPF